MELLHFLLDGSQSSVAEHLQTLLYAILVKDNMIDEVSYLIYFLVERCYGVEEWLDFLIMATVMIIMTVFFSMRECRRRARYVRVLLSEFKDILTPTHKKHPGHIRSTMMVE